MTADAEQREGDGKMAETMAVKIPVRDQIDPNVPLLSVCVQFIKNDKCTMEENLAMLQQTISSVLCQDYLNLVVEAIGSGDVWLEFSRWATATNAFGPAVTYSEAARPALHKQADYLMWLHSGDTLCDDGYAAAAIRALAGNDELLLAFAGDSGLQLLPEMEKGKWTKISGPWLVSHYAELWCAPETVIIRSSAAEKQEIGRLMPEEVSKFVFVPLLLEGQVAFYRADIARPGSVFRGGDQELFVRRCANGLQQLDEATMEILIGGCDRGTLERWRNWLAEQWFGDMIEEAGGRFSAIDSLYELSRQFGVARQAYGALARKYCEHRAVGIR